MRSPSRWTTRSVGTTPDATSAAYTLAVGNVVDTALEAALVAIGGVIVGAITPANSAPTAVVLTNTIASIDENTATASHIKVADIAVIDDALGTNTLGLTGADAAFFEIVGTSLYIKAGTVLDFGTKASYAVAVTVDDPDKGGTPDATSAIYTLAVADVNAAPTVALTNTTASIDENAATASHIKVADIVVTDDGLGTNTLGLTGADAAFFEIDGTSLYLKAGTVLDFETKASYAIAVTVDDTSVGTTPDASVTYTLALSDVNEAAPGDATAGQQPPIDGGAQDAGPSAPPSAPFDFLAFLQHVADQIPGFGAPGFGTPLAGTAGFPMATGFAAPPSAPFDPSGFFHQTDSFPHFAFPAPPPADSFGFGAPGFATALAGAGGPAFHTFNAPPADPFDPFGFSHQTDPFGFLHQADPFADFALPALSPGDLLLGFGPPLVWA